MTFLEAVPACDVMLDNWPLRSLSAAAMPATEAPLVCALVAAERSSVETLANDVASALKLAAIALICALVGVPLIAIELLTAPICASSAARSVLMAEFCAAVVLVVAAMFTAADCVGAAVLPPKTPKYHKPRSIMIMTTTTQTHVFLDI